MEEDGTRWSEEDLMEYMWSLWKIEESEPATVDKA